MSALESGNVSLGTATYQYMNYLKNPGQAGSTSNGTLQSLGTNANVLSGYATALWDGGPNNPVTTTNDPLGNAFFYNTGQKCNIDNSGNSSSDSSSNTVLRYVYINNIPVGSIGGARGILPGIIEKMEDFDPLGFFDELLQTGTPTCQLVTLEVIDNNNNSSYESNYVALFDIKPICNNFFEDKINPMGSVSCGEGYQNLKKKPKKKNINYFNILIVIFLIILVVFNF
jgi:hypothetical protein